MVGSIRYVLMLGVVLIFCGWVLDAAAEESRNDRPRVVCFGDSITAGKYPGILAKRMPGIRVINAGAGGNTTDAGLNRMDIDVLSKNPDVVLIMFGTNDSVLTAPGKYKVALPKFKANLEKMVVRCRARGATPVLATLLPIVEAPYYTRHPKAYYEPEGGLAAILERYRAVTMAVAKACFVPLVDMNRLIQADETHIKPDGVHPNKFGEAAIAEYFEAALEDVFRETGIAKRKLSSESAGEGRVNSKS